MSLLSSVTDTFVVDWVICAHFSKIYATKRTWPPSLSTWVSHCIGNIKPASTWRWREWQTRGGKKRRSCWEFRLDMLDLHLIVPKKSTVGEAGVGKSSGAGRWVV